MTKTPRSLNIKIKTQKQYTKYNHQKNQKETKYKPNQQTKSKKGFPISKLKKGKEEFTQDRHAHRSCIHTSDLDNVGSI